MKAHVMKGAGGKAFLRIAGYFVLSAFAFGGLLSCQGPLVDERYAVFTGESINGVNAFFGLLEGDGRKVIRSPYLTRKIMEDADVVVYFARGDENRADLARFESWLHGVPFRPPPAVIDAEEAGRNPARLALPGQPDHPGGELPEDLAGSEDSESAEEDLPGNVDEAEPDLFEEAENESEDESEESEDDSDDDLLVDDSDTEGEEFTPPIRERPVTVLYFDRDTDASVPFWDLLRQQMEGNRREQDFARDVLRVRLEEREQYPDHVEILFGRRKMLDQAGRPLRGMIVHPLLGGAWLEEMPVRFVPEPPQSYYDDVDLPFRTLVETRQGYDLMREFVVAQGRVIYSYNAEWALNYSLVRKNYRRFATTLIDHALSRHKTADPIKIYWISGSLRPPADIQEEENSLLRPFTIFPLNVVLFQMLLLLLLFLLARWPHEHRPRAGDSSGRREFLEHIRFLGMKLRRGKNPFDSLEGLAAYVKRHRTDAVRWERAIAALFSKSGDQSDQPAPDRKAKETRQEKQ